MAGFAQGGAFRLAPVAAITLPAFGQTLGDQCFSQALPAAGDDAQVATIFILIAVDRLQGEIALVEQGQQPELGLLAEPFFGGAAGAGDFRCVDVGDPDLAALEPDGVAVDDAGGAVGAEADAEAGTMGIDADRCAGGGRTAAEEDREKQRGAHGRGDRDEGGPADVVHPSENRGERLKEIEANGYFDEWNREPSWRLLRDPGIEPI